MDLEKLDLTTLEGKRWLWTVLGNISGDFSRLEYRITELEAQLKQKDQK